MPPIKFNHSLADIPNPHPLMIVAENHGVLGQSLYTMRSLQHQKKKNHTHFFTEHNQTASDSIKTNIQICKSRGIPAFDRNNATAIMSLAMHLQLQELGMKQVFADLPNRNIDKDTSYAGKKNQISEESDRHIKQIIRDRLGNDPILHSAEYQRGIAYAFCGRPVFDRLQTRLALDADQKETIALIGAVSRMSHDKQNALLTHTAQLEERNAYNASVIAATHKSHPPSKKIACNGLRHIMHAPGYEIAKEHTLPFMLQDRYGIASTCVTFTDKGAIAKNRAQLEKMQIAAGDVNSDEIYPYLDWKLKATNTDAYFALNNADATESIHDVRDNAALDIDYVVVLPFVENEEVYAVAASKIKHLLHLK